MRRGAGGIVFLLLAALALSGCSVVVATGVAVATVTAATVKTAGKVTVATVTTTGKVVSSAVTSSGDVASMSMESAAKLARTGMVVAVDASSGTVTELPWQEGMRLYTTAQSGRLGKAYDAATIFRGSKRIAADLRRVRAGLEDHELKSGDVVELRRRA
ncbi:MAG: hypothetical protein HZA32_03735 [Opitutae bacterium]|nr:hypothetical protein [Opitutae bacterium]